MSRDMYKTAQGKMVDMGALRLQNEHVRAVGNMKINARGDQIDDTNKIVRTKNQQVNAQYAKQVAPKGQK